MMSKYDMPSIPYVESRFQFGKQKPSAIILRGTFTTSDEGAALGLAQAWHKAPEPWASGHFTVDARKRFRCTPDRVIAGTPGCSDKGAVRIAICAEPFSGDIFWHEDTHLPVLFRAAELVAELTLAYKIPVRYLEVESLERWMKRPATRRGGIIVDTPEGWPYERFLSEVKAQRALKTII
jgi:hypothetical protein